MTSLPCHPLPVPVPRREAYASDFIHKTLEACRQAERAGRSVLDEIDTYLNAPLVADCEDVVRWWGVSSFYLLAR